MLQACMITMIQVLSRDDEHHPLDLFCQVYSGRLCYPAALPKTTNKRAPERCTVILHSFFSITNFATQSLHFHFLCLQGKAYAQMLADFEVHGMPSLEELVNNHTELS